MAKRIKFEIKDKDGIARIAKLKIGSKKLETPYFFPVINPYDEILPFDEIKKYFSFPAIITNAYILMRKGESIDDIHKFLKYDGIVMTDSGAFQWMKYGKIEIKQEEIIKFEEKIKSDIKVPLDKPVLSEDYKEAKESVKITLKNMEEFLRIKNSYGWIFPIQGSYYKDLIKKCIDFLMKYDDEFDGYAIGSLVSSLEKYEYDKLIKQFLTVKLLLPFGKFIHGFGAGLPITIPILVFLGIDTFDSSSYILYAKDLRYMTERGVKRLEDLHYLPCNCPICSKYDIEDLKELERVDKKELIKLLAIHNLYVIIKTINEVKQAIKEGRLYDLVYQVARSHPKVFFAFLDLIKKKEFVELYKKLDPIRKRKGLFYYGEKRPEIERAFERLKKRVGKLRSSMKLIYPFGQLVGLELKYKEVKDELEILKDLMNYQFGRNVGTKFVKKYKNRIKIKRSRTGRLKDIFVDENLFGHIRARDGFISLTLYGAKLIEDIMPDIYKVVIYNKYKEKIKSSILPKHIKKFDERLLANEEVIIYDEDGNIFAVGVTKVSGIEMKDLKSGEVIRIKKKEL